MSSMAPGSDQSIWNIGDFWKWLQRGLSAVVKWLSLIFGRFQNDFIDRYWKSKINWERLSRKCFVHEISFQLSQSLLLLSWKKTFEYIEIKFFEYRSFWISIYNMKYVYQKCCSICFRGRIEVSQFLWNYWICLSIHETNSWQKWTPLQLWSWIKGKFNSHIKIVHTIFKLIQLFCNLKNVTKYIFITS